MRVDPAQEALGRQRIIALRDRRDNAATSVALDALSNAARGTANLMPHIVRAVENYATLGEISTVLRSVFGEYDTMTTSG